MPSLSDKLKSLGVSVGLKPTGEAEDNPQQPEIGQQVSAVTAAHPKLDDVLGGHTLKNSQGETYIVESHYPLDYQHGRVGLLAASSLRMLATWAGNPDMGDLKPESFAFLDTETTGLSGGSGTYAFLIGAARFEESEFHLTQFFMRDPADEPAELVALEQFLAPCQAIVTFNGKTFDAPLLNTRYLLQGWRSPLFDLGHFDLLHLARRLWRDRLPSRTLMNLEVQILGTERTEEDIPGWAIPQMYFDYIRSGDPTPLKNVLYHNAMDVVSLAALFNHMAGLLAHPFEASIEHGVDLIALARLYEDLGETETAIGLYLQGLEFEDRSTVRIVEESPEVSFTYTQNLSDSDPLSQNRQPLPRAIFLDALDRLALIHKRNQDYPTAITLWEKAASHQHIHAHIELSKYYEHHQRNYAVALYWVQSAMVIIHSTQAAAAERLLWSQELETRLARLQRKLSLTGGETTP